MIKNEETRLEDIEPDTNEKLKKISAYPEKMQIAFQYRHYSTENILIGKFTTEVEQ